MNDLIQTIGASMLGGGVVSFVSKWWLSFQLERFKHDQVERLEPVKSQLALLVRLQAGVEEKRAEIAAQVLLACLRYLDMLMYVTSPMHIQRSDEPSGPGSFAKVIDERWGETHDLQMQFSNSRALADTYLPLEIAALMDRVWELRAEIRANQSTHFAMVGQGPGMGTEYWRKGFGSIPEALATKLKEEAKSLLRPIVLQEQRLVTQVDAGVARGVA